MVGPLGGDALAASTTGAMNTMSMLMLPMGVAFIVHSFAAQLKGRGDLVSAREIGGKQLPEQRQSGPRQHQSRDGAGDPHQQVLGEADTYELPAIGAERTT